MTLVSGSRLGVYEVQSRLGAGGMGEVYRARDTQLGRDVALKVLLPEVAHDPERLARFRREAQILASLNHPHIAAIYGLQESAGTVLLVLLADAHVARLDDWGRHVARHCCLYESRAGEGQTRR